MTDHLEIQAFVKQYGTSTWACRHAVSPDSQIVVPVAVAKSVEETKQLFIQQALALLEGTTDISSLSLYDILTLQEIYYKNYGPTGVVKEKPDVKDLKLHDGTTVTFAFYTVTTRY